MGSGVSDGFAQISWFFGEVVADWSTKAFPIEICADRA